MVTPQKSNEFIPRIAIFKGNYLLQTIILGIQPLVFGSVLLAAKRHDDSTGWFL